jgi:Asp-tRNA(Asn)/Glu-tRNA(Gln) amidotransferase C subunit
MSLFYNKIDDAKDILQTVLPTEIARPFDIDFDPTKINALASDLGSIFQTAQSFRNIFNTNISPSDIAQLAKNGLTKELSKLVSDNGLSSLFKDVAEFNKTSYSFKESENKLNSANLKLNYNPFNIFPSFIERYIRNSSEENAKLVTDYYIQLNISRLEIFNQNTILFDIIDQLVDIHSSYNLTSYSSGIQSIFNSDEVYNEVYSIYDQLNNAIDILYDYIASYSSFIKFIKDKEQMDNLISSLNSVIDNFSQILTVDEIKYSYEDLKTLRKIDTDTVFTPI